MRALSRILLFSLLLGCLTNLLLAWAFIRVATAPGALASVWLGSVPVESRLNTTFSAYFDDDPPRCGVCYIGPVDLLSTAVIINPGEPNEPPCLPLWSRWPALDAALAESVGAVRPDGLTYILEEAVGWPRPSLWRGWVQSAAPAAPVPTHETLSSASPAQTVRFLGTLTQGPSAFASAWPGELSLMPIHPLWSGLLVNSMIFSSAWLPVIALAVNLRGMRARHRCRRNLCPACAYSLSGNTSRICPECGTPVAPPPPATRSR